MFIFILELLPSGGCHQIRFYEEICCCMPPFRCCDIFREPLQEDNRQWQHATGYASRYPARHATFHHK